MRYENIEEVYTEITERIYPYETLRINIDSLNESNKSHISITNHYHSSTKKP